MRPSREEICWLIRKEAERITGDSTLECWCGICSTAIAKAFSELGYDATLCFGHFRDSDDHCWVVSDGVIYDITAAQFGKQFPFLLLDFPDENGGHLPLYPDPIEKLNFRTAEEGLGKFFKEWPEEQIPTAELLQRLLHPLCKLSVAA